MMTTTCTLQSGGLLHLGEGRTRAGVLGFDRSHDGSLVAAVDLGGVSVLDAQRGHALARRDCICAPAGLVRFAVDDCVVVFVRHDGCVEAWDWAADEVLGVFGLPEPARALATCARPVVAALLESRIEVFDLVGDRSIGRDVDPRSTRVALSPSGDELSAFTGEDLALVAAI